jgi:hypothetical protein
MSSITLGWSGLTRKVVAFASIITLACLPAFADGVTKRVRFARGTSATTIRNAVIRGERDRYLVAAKAGQTMTVKITSLDKNAVFQIYLSGEQESLPGAGETDDATKWSGRLPADNEYVIVVGGTRGNASYTLTISIK